MLVLGLGLGRRGLRLQDLRHSTHLQCQRTRLLPLRALTVGPGHFILYMPLQVLPFDRPRNEEDAAGGNLGEEAGVPPINYKKFRKGSAGEASLEKRILPLVVVEGRVPRNEGGDAVLRAEMKRMENKRKADALFRDDERGGKVTEKRRKK